MGLDFQKEGAPQQGTQPTFRDVSPVLLQLFSSEHQGLPAVPVILVSRALAVFPVLGTGDGEAVEGHKVPSVAAPAFVRVLLQEGSTLALRAGPLSLGPQLVGCLLQQWGTEGQNASLLLRGLLACRRPLHPCKAMDGGLSQSGRDIPNSRWEFPSAQSWWGKASFSYSAPGSTLLPPLTAPCLLRGGRPLSSILDVSGHPCVLQPLKDVVAHQPVQPIIHVLPGTSGKDVSQQLGGKHWPYDGCKLQNHLLLQRDPVQLSQCNLCQEEAKRLSLLCPGA